MDAKKRLKGQLRQNGRLGKAAGFCFVDAATVVERLMKDGTSAVVTIGQRFRNQSIMRMRNAEAVAWVNGRPDGYSYEAYYDGVDGMMHIEAIGVQA